MLQAPDSQESAIACRWNPRPIRTFAKFLTRSFQGLFEKTVLQQQSELGFVLWNQRA